VRLVELSDRAMAVRVQRAGDLRLEPAICSAIT
jgi:hypothetical protein